VELLLYYISAQYDILLLISLLFAGSLVYFKGKKKLIGIFIMIIIVSIITALFLPNILLFLGIFLPTLIHVYLFTLLFVISGCIKNKSKYGISLAVLILLVPAIIYYLPIELINYMPTERIKVTLAENELLFVGKEITKFFYGFQTSNTYLSSEIGIKIEIFIAFAYTYHYLNWFSKTTVIGWRKAVTKKNGLLILLFWLISVCLYMYDFKTGLMALFFLSLLHVLLEFPLNIISIKEIASTIRSKMNN